MRKEVAFIFVDLYYKEQLLKFKYQTWANLNSIEPHAPPE